MNILMIIHIIISCLALAASIGALGITLLTKRSTSNVESYTLLTGSLVSGVVLVVVTPSSLTHMCISGILLSLTCLGLAYVNTRAGRRTQLTA